MKTETFMEYGEDDKAATTKNEELEFLAKAKDQHRIPLMVRANVIGIGVGQRTRKGQRTDELVLKVYVLHKLPKDLLAENDLIPSTLEFDNKEVPVDVEESDIPKAQIFNLRSRPIIGGSSIGPAAVVAGTNWFGTLGVCVTLDNNQTYILSNNHVLALVDQLPIGANIVQPSISDGGIAPTTAGLGDQVATLSNVVPIRFGTFTVVIGGNTITIPIPNSVDCALAVVRNAFNSANREIHWIGYPANTISYPVAIPLPFGGGRIIIPSKVCKMGRTTEFTVGDIVDVSWDGFIDYSPMFGNAPGTNRAWFQDQLRIDGGSRPFSLSGDSGSLVLTFPSLQPAGLLFAGSGNFSICNYIATVMRRLGISRI